MAQPVDFVVTWVDGADPAWQAERAAYAPRETADTDPSRYRDWGTLRYWFRGVEAFAPWVRQVHLLTAGPLPPWLDTACPRLHVVRHEEILPPQALPTFNSNALEMNLHRIPGLAEHFVYFNDDMFLLRPAAPEDFFLKDLPRDMLALQPVVANPDNPVMSRILLNDSLVISRHFEKRRTLRQLKGKYFHPGYPLWHWGYNLLETFFPRYTGFYTVHGPSPFRRETFLRLWELEPDVLTQTTLHRFRCGEDVTQYLFREWQKQEGAFVPANLHRGFAYREVHQASQACEIIRRQKKKILCLNDTHRPVNFEATRAAVLAAFEAILPQPSSFER